MHWRQVSDSVDLKCQGRQASKRRRRLPATGGRLWERDIVTDACLVRRVIIDNGVATGIEYTTAGADWVASARQEVILTAGAIGVGAAAAGLGIGPADHLREVGAEVVLDLPGVGTNLHDHAMSTVVYSAAEGISNNPNNMLGQAIFGLVETEHATDWTRCAIVAG